MPQEAVFLFLKQILSSRRGIRFDCGPAVQKIKANAPVTLLIRRSLVPFDVDDEAFRHLHASIGFCVWARRCPRMIAARFTDAGCVL
jgi:hypothetical protein